MLRTATGLSIVLAAGIIPHIGEVILVTLVVVNGRAGVFTITATNCWQTIFEDSRRHPSGVVGKVADGVEA